MSGAETLPLLVLVLLGLFAAAGWPRATPFLCAAGALGAALFLLGGAEAGAMVVPVLIPGGVVLALDGLSGFFLLVVLIAAAASTAVARPAAGAPVFVAGMVLALLAGDAVSLVAGFELMSAASLILILANHTDSGVRVTAGLYGGMAALAALSLIAGLALLGAAGPELGSLGFAAMRAHPPQTVLWPVFLLILLGAGSKAGLAPLHVWLPPAHAAAPAPVSAMMSGAMTKVALYVLARTLFDLCGPATPGWWGVVLLALGAGGAVLGALRAATEDDLKTALACSTVEHVGLITAGMGLALIARAADLPALASLALAASLLHVAAHGLFKPLLFLLSGAVLQEAGSRHFAYLGGLAARMRRAAACGLVGAACLAALPPSPAFASEWLLLQSVFAAPRVGELALQIIFAVAAVAIGLAAGLGAFAAVRLFGVAFLGRPRSPRAAAASEPDTPMLAALAVLTALVTLAGLFPAAVLNLARPALRLLVGASVDDRATIWMIAPQADGIGYAPLATAFVMGGAALLALALVRRSARRGHRAAPVWDCGFAAPPAWMPFGDPATQYGAAGLSQPLRRVLGPVLSQREDAEQRSPGDTRPALLRRETVDPADRLLFRPMAAARARVSAAADVIHRLTARQALAVILLVLVALLATIAASGTS